MRPTWERRAGLAVYLPLTPEPRPPLRQARSASGKPIDMVALKFPDTGGREAELFRFRREILGVRPVSGLSLVVLRD